MTCIAAKSIIICRYMQRAYIITLMYAVYLGGRDCDDLVRWKRSVCAGKWSLRKIINIRVSARMILTFRTRNQSWPAK